MANQSSQLGITRSDLAVRASEDAKIALLRAKGGRSAKGMLLIGRHRAARIDHIDQVCESLKTIDVCIVRLKMSKRRSLPAVLAGQLQSDLQLMPADAGLRAPGGEVLHALAGFVRNLKPVYHDIDMSIDHQPEPGVAAFGTLEYNLSSLLGVIGAAAARAGTACAILIDEMHDVEAEQLSAMLGALHRIAQDVLPVVLIGAGATNLRRRVGIAKPYAERMFQIIDLD